MTEQFTPDQNISIQGWAIHDDLENGGKVELWWPLDKADDKFHLKFTNKDGEETRLGLSGQAMQALQMLYIRALRYQSGEEQISSWSIQVQVDEVKADE